MLNGGQVMNAKDLAINWYLAEADIHLDVIDFTEDAWKAAILFCAKFAEELKVDRMGKLGEFQVADALRELIEEES